MTKHNGQRVLRVGVLLSGEGTSLENLFEYIEARGLPARVVVVISSKREAGGLARARRRAVPTLTAARRELDVDTMNDRIHKALGEHGVELVALLGFLSPFQVRGRYEGRVINVHPSLIPAFSGPGMYGRHVHEAVLERGAKVTGVTVHFVDDEYDTGPILLQRALPVEAEDTAETLAARVQALERELLPEAIRLIAEGRVKISNGHTQIKPE